MVDVGRPQTKRKTQEHVEKGSGEGNVDGRLQVQVEENGGDSSRQRQME